MMIYRKTFGPRPMPIAHRLLRSIRVSDRECWEYIGTINGQGYAWVQVNRKYHNGHRLSYLIHKGHIPAGMVVMHKCDNPCCINPDHLELGTPTQNHEDMRAKRRHAFGRRVNTAKLNDEIVRSIRREVGSNKSLARKYGVRRQTIASVRARKTWKHVL
jgi:hypothetical protein